jgi:hypothetical protein
VEIFQCFRSFAHKREASEASEWKTAPAKVPGACLTVNADGESMMALTGWGLGGSSCKLIEWFSDGG